MINVFDAVRDLLKLDAVCIDNNVFRLHYKATVVMLVTFSLIVTARQYVGDPINCLVDGVPNQIMDSYCWIHSTFTVTKKIGGRVGKDIVQPGVGPYREGEDIVKYHKYYQWVCFVLFFQAVFFYVPRYIWKILEGGRIRVLVNGLDDVMITEEQKAKGIKLLVDYFTDNLHAHNFYAVQFFVCELLNFVNVVAQMLFLHYFFEGEFARYGLDIFRFTDMEPAERVDAMSRIFPKVAKCTFERYGFSGTIQKFDGLCLLPLNIVNEKIYAFLWFWFLFIAVISGINMAYRTTVIISSRFRLVLLKMKSRLSRQDELFTIVENFQVGDWFVLYQIGNNCKPRIFRELVSNLAALQFNDNEDV
ncbi:innexin inx2-like [Rhopalosiphum maidis]|uniref:innexin inx2-like n=1 Tax=Rhopalosiphum maidis TaxID=43146 RepID=UPI000EFFD8A7|nr:innexin inx2-like [Rhopalosiphum maidis]